MKWHYEVGSTLAQDYEIEANNEEEAETKAITLFKADLARWNLLGLLIEGIETDDIYELD